MKLGVPSHQQSLVMQLNGLGMTKVVVAGGVVIVVPPIRVTAPRTPTKGRMILAVLRAGLVRT